MNTQTVLIIIDVLRKAVRESLPIWKKLIKEYVKKDVIVEAPTSTGPAGFLLQLLTNVMF